MWSGAHLANLSPGLRCGRWWRGYQIGGFSDVRPIVIDEHLIPVIVGHDVLSDNAVWKLVLTSLAFETDPLIRPMSDPFVDKHHVFFGKMRGETGSRFKPVVADRAREKLGDIRLGVNEILMTPVTSWIGEHLFAILAREVLLRFMR